ncbi:MAG: hypothetical protein GY867_02360 [bacterium]|nr:hypothetical protein [bacterium]
MTVYITKLLNLQQGELGRALLMFLYAFLLMSAYLILKPVRNSLFLDRFGADQLVYMYMIIAVTATPIASFYGWSASRTSLPRLVGATTLFIVVNLAIFWYLIGQQFSWLVYVFYVWVSLFGVFTTSQLWLLANYVFDAREAKRIFPMIAAGAILGGMMGSLLTNLFAVMVGTENLLWLCVGFMLVCFGILMAVWRMRPIDGVGKDKKKKQSRALGGMLPVILKSRHLTLLTLMVSLTVIVSTFVDFQFNKVVKDAFEDKDKLTAFFGAFFFALSVVSLLLQLLLSSRILRRFGIGMAILFLPVGLLLGSAAIFIAPVLASAILVKISDGSFRYSINKTGLELLYLPVPAAVKSRVKALIDVAGDRVARGVGGGLLYIVNDLLSWPVQWISFLSAAIIAGWIAVAVMIKREYSRTFRDALARRAIDTDQVHVKMHEAASIEALTGILRTGDRRQILFALELTAQENSPKLAGPYSQLLTHNDNEIKKRALSALVKVGNEELCPQIKPLLADDDPEIRVHTIRYLCTHTSGDRKALFESFLHQDDPLLRASACRSALEYGLGDFTEDLLTRALYEEIMTNDGEDGRAARQQLAIAMRFATSGDPLTSLLPRLVSDPDPGTRRSALIAAAALDRREFLPAIIGYLGDPQLNRLGQDALMAFGPAILDSLRDYLNDVDVPLVVRLRLPSLISRIGSERSVEILQEQLESKFVLLRYGALRGLNRIRHHREGPLIPENDVRELMKVEARGYYEIYTYVEGIASGRSNSRAEKLLLQTLDNRQRLHLEQAFRLAGLIYPIDDMYNAYNGVTSSVKTMRARAIEFLDTVWENEEKRHLFPILERNVRLDEAGRQLFELPAISREATLRSLLQGDDAWLAACAAFVVAEEKLLEYRNDIEPLVDSDNDALRETARTALDTFARG